MEQNNSLMRKYVEHLILPYVRSFTAALRTLKAELQNGFFVRTDTTAVMTKGLYGTIVTLDGSGGSVTPNLQDGNIFRVETSEGSGVIESNVTINTPSNIQSGMAIIYVKQGPAGGNAITLDSGYKVQGGELSVDPDDSNILYLTFDGGSVIDVTISQRGE